MKKTNLTIRGISTVSKKSCLHKELCDLLNKTYSKKNADYGDSFSMTRAEFGNQAILIRLSDKFFRLKTLLQSGSAAQVPDESIEDTLLDLANYCLMEVVERKNDRAVVKTFSNEAINEENNN